MKNIRLGDGVNRDDYRRNFRGSPEEVALIIEQEFTNEQREHLFLAMDYLTKAQRIDGRTAIFTNSRYPACVSEFFNYLKRKYPERYEDFSLQNHAFVFGYTALLVDHPSKTQYERYQMVLKAPEVSKAHHLHYYLEEYPSSTVIYYDDSKTHVNAVNKAIDDLWPNVKGLAHVFPSDPEALAFLGEEIKCLDEEFEAMKKEALKKETPVVAGTVVYENNAARTQVEAAVANPGLAMLPVYTEVDKKKPNTPPVTENAADATAEQDPDEPLPPTQMDDAAGKPGTSQGAGQQKLGKK